MIEIFTDGSYKSSLNQGGYSAIVTENKVILAKLYHGFKNTTNNRMEMRGVLEALKFFKNPSQLIVYSDSAYVVNSLNQGHVRKWFKNQDLSKKNLDLWFEIINLVDFHDVTFKWVKGHNKHEMNELADLYAQHASLCMNLPKDLKY